MEATSTADNADDGGWVTLGKSRRSSKRAPARQIRRSTSTGFTTPRSNRSQESATTAGTNKAATPREQKGRGKGRPRNRQPSTAKRPVPSVRPVEDEGKGRARRVNDRKPVPPQSKEIGNLLKQALANAADPEDLTTKGRGAKKGKQQQGQKAHFNKQRRQVEKENKAAQPVPARVTVNITKGSPWGKKPKAVVEKKLSPRAEIKAPPPGNEKLAENEAATEENEAVAATEENEAVAATEGWENPPAETPAPVSKQPKGFAVPKASTKWGSKSAASIVKASVKESTDRKKENKAGTPTPTRIPAATPTPTKSESLSRDGSHPPTIRSSGPRPVASERKVWPTISPKAAEPRPTVEDKASPRHGTLARQQPPKNHSGGEPVQTTPTVVDGVGMNWAFTKAATQPAAQATSPTTQLNPLAKAYVSPRDNKSPAKPNGKKTRNNKKKNKGFKNGKSSSPLSRNAKTFQPKNLAAQNGAPFPTPGVLPQVMTAGGSLDASGLWVPHWPAGAVWPAGIPAALPGQGQAGQPTF